MTTRQVLKPVRLELNNSGAWKVLGRFDAADDEQTSLVLDAAAERRGKRLAQQVRLTAQLGGWWQNKRKDER